MPTFATLDEELAFLKAQIKKARAARTEGPAANDTDEHARAYFPRGTETVADGYIHRLSARSKPVPSDDEVPAGREYRRRNR